MENIIKGGRSVDFETVESLVGTFIANKYDETHEKKKAGKIEFGRLRPITDEDIKEGLTEKESHSRMKNQGDINKK